MKPKNARTNRKIRLLVGKVGLDGHDRGVKILARAFRDAGFEVIYSGLHQTPEMIANMAIQEGVDAVGLSIHSGAHNELFPEVKKLLKEKGADSIRVFGGGIIPAKDIASLKEHGIEEIFLPGTQLDTIIEWVKKNI
ncbi:MAG: cobalamin B12-binding domain-containing protein [Pseudomonadota bacterium]